MPRRNYLVYFDSNVISAAADPRRAKTDSICRTVIKQTTRYCTLVYSQTTLLENGPERSTLPRLARRRLAMLRGANRKVIGYGRNEILHKATAILNRVGHPEEPRDSTLTRDAMHFASAILGKAELLVTANLGDFRFLARAKEGASIVLEGVRVLSPMDASGWIADNPPPPGKRPVQIRGMHPAIARLYARQQYWSMRDWGYTPRQARAYIKKKWRITVYR